MCFWCALFCRQTKCTSSLLCFANTPHALKFIAFAHILKLCGFGLCYVVCSFSFIHFFLSCVSFCLYISWVHKYPGKVCSYLAVFFAHISSGIKVCGFCWHTRACGFSPCFEVCTFSVYAFIFVAFVHTLIFVSVHSHWGREHSQSLWRLWRNWKRASHQGSQNKSGQRILLHSVWG